MFWRCYKFLLLGGEWLRFSKWETNVNILWILHWWRTLTTVTHNNLVLPWHQAMKCFLKIYIKQLTTLRNYLWKCKYYFRFSFLFSDAVTGAKKSILWKRIFILFIITLSTTLYTFSVLKSSPYEEELQ